jgi:hypothetical protein
MPTGPRRSIWAAAVVCFSLLAPVAAQEPSLSEDQIREFLLKAKVIKFKRTSKGITSPWRLTLSDGQLTHDAAYQSIDERKVRMDFDGGRSEINFRDSYHFNIAGYELAKLVGLGDMVPVCVEREWRGDRGSFCWWLPVKMDESTRLSKKIKPPDQNAWNKQLNKMWVFSELLYDTDRNMTNTLISEDWKLYMIDFSRAFRQYHNLLAPENLTMCDRQLLDSLRQLKEADVLSKTASHIGKNEVKAVMARRDKIVQLFDKKIAEKGEPAVLY